MIAGRLPARLAAVGLLAWTLLPSAAAGQAGFNPALSSLQPNRWVQLTPTVTDALGNDVTDLGFPRNGYSGITFAPDHHAIVMFGGGGHGDREGNDVWLYDTATNHWREMYLPDPASTYPSMSRTSYDSDCTDGTWGNGYTCGATTTGRPWTSHSYDQMAYDTVNGKYLFWGPNFNLGYGYYGDQDLFSYDIGSNTWQHLNSGPPLFYQMGASEFDPANGLLVAANQGAVHTYNVSTRVWTRKKDSPAGFQDANMVYDTVNRVMLLFGSDYPAGNALLSYDAGRDLWTTLNPTPDPAYGLPPAGAPYAGFDSIHGVMLVWGQGDTGSFVPTWAYDVRSNAWKKMNPTGGEPATRADAGADLTFDPVNNVFYLLVSDNTYATIGGLTGPVAQLWAYRYGTSAGGDATPPAPPQNLSAKPGQ